MLEPDEPAARAAATWLARRDRGLTPAEQDAYLQWLREDPSHGATIAQLEKTWQKLNLLAAWQPEHSTRPNPDLLAPRPRRIWWPALTGLAAALVVGLLLFGSGPAPVETVVATGAVIHPGPQRMTLPDGSLVELNAGAKVDVRYTAEKRVVRLVSGEAHFVVAKNPGCPFEVEAQSLSVRAVGTAFAVTLGGESVAVRVTEGIVEVEDAHPAMGQTGNRVLSQVTAGQLATVRALDSGAPRLELVDITPSQMDAELAWRGIRLEFVDLPLRDVVAEFNRYNTRKLVIADASTGSIVVGGNFRADNVDPFVRLLDVGFDISAETGENEIVLRKR